MEITENAIVGKIVAENYACSDIFYQYGIDFCCGGNISVGEACRQINLDKQEKANLIDQLNNSAVQQKFSRQINPNILSLDALVDYIEKEHHQYIETNVPIILEYLHKIVAVHGAEHKELFEIERLFKKASGALVIHLKKEELTLFPAIRKFRDIQKNEGLSADVIAKFTNIMHQLTDDHEEEGELFRRISELSNHYTPPENACQSYKITYAKLKDFELDLHFHIHLENNILFNKLRDSLG